jgi:hypothetical protein
MNAISHCKAFAFFPQTTLGQQQTIKFNQWRTQQIPHGESLEVWQDRKYVSLDAPSADVVLQPRSEFYVGISRSPGDRYCYTLDLPYYGFREKQPDFLECNSFKIRYNDQLNYFNFLDETVEGPTGNLAYIFDSDEHMAIFGEPSLEKYSSSIGQGTHS